LLGGQIQFSFLPPGNTVAHVRAGKLKAIAVPGDQRLKSLPQTPTFSEAGMPGFEVKSWIAMFAPAATPKSIVDRLSAEIAKAVMMPEARDRLAGQGHEPFPKTPEQFGAYLKAEMARVDKVVKAADIKFDP